MMKSLRVLSVASEIYPLIKIGELADVTGALPIALKPEGIEVHCRAGISGCHELARAGRGRDSSAEFFRRRGSAAPNDILRTRPVRSRRAASVRAWWKPLSQARRHGLAGQRIALCCIGASSRRYWPWRRLVL